MERLGLRNPRNELDVLLKTMSNELLPEKDVLQNLWCFSTNVCPKSLFRYRKLNDHTLEDLKNDEVAFSIAKDFTGDPEDCTLHDQGGLDQAVESIISLNPSDFILKNQTISMYEYFKNINLDTIRDREAVLCLTDNPLSKYFWNSYLGDGADFCVVYDTESLKISNLFSEVGTFILPVVYAETLPETNQYAAWTTICNLPFEELNIPSMRYGLDSLNLPNEMKDQLKRNLSVFENLSPNDQKSRIQGLAYIDFVKTVFYKLSCFQDESEWRVITPLKSSEQNIDHPVRRWPASVIIIKDTLAADKIATLVNVAHCPIKYLNSQDFRMDD